MTALFISWVSACTVCLSLAALFERARPNSSAAVRHTMWLIATLVALSWPLVALLAPDWSAPRIVAPLWNSSSESVSWYAFNPDIGSAPSTNGSPSARQPMVASAEAFGAGSLMFGTWAIGALLLLVVGACRYASAYRLIGRARPIMDREIVEDCDRVAGACGLSRIPALLQSPEVESPVAWGFGVGSIVFPDWLTDAEPATRRAILCHEMAHIARRDHLVQLLGTLFVALHWYHPLAWVGRAAMRRNAEMACDDRVVRAGALPSWYAEQLLRLATRASVTTSLPIPGIMGSGDLEGRIVSLTDCSRSRTPPARWRMAVIAVMMFCCATLLAGARPPLLAAARAFALPTSTEFMAQPEPGRPAPDGTAAVNTQLPLWRQVDGPCPAFIGRRDLVRHCEHREIALSLASLALIAGQNGDVVITGTDDDQVRVQAILDVQAAGPTAAQELSARIELHADRQFRAVIPDLDTQEWVGISYVIEVPRNMPIRVATRNGNVVVRDLSGRLEIETINGTIDLADMSGAVFASGNNAQYRVQLDASVTGARYELSTQNGSIDVTLPDSRAVGIDLMTERGELRAEGGIRANLRCNPSPGGCIGGRAELGDSLAAQLRVRTIHGNITLRSVSAGATAQ